MSHGVTVWQEERGVTRILLLAGSQEEQQRLAEQRLKEEQAKKAKEAAASKALNVTVDVQVRPVLALGGALPHSPFAYELRLC